MKKLVRDNIPQIIKATGKAPNYLIAEKAEYTKLLKEKLLEEINEFIDSEEIEELADILEVLDAIYKNFNFKLEDILKIKKEKRNSRGSFSKKYILYN